MGPTAEWYFDGTRWYFKLARFLNLLEDEVVKVSLTGLTMWATTINNISQLTMSHDALQVGGSILANATALVAHGVKRGQILKAGK